MDLIESLRQLDIDVFRALNAAGQNSVLDAVMIALTILGFSYIIVLLCVPLWFQKKRDAAFDLVVLVILVSLVTEAIKIIVGRERPYLVLDNVNTLLTSSGPSFPSAHASRAFAVALLVSATSRRPNGAMAFVVAGLIGTSRIYLGVHWPSDVLFGALLGLVLAEMLMMFGKRSQSYRNFRKRIIDSVRIPRTSPQRVSLSASERAV